MFKFTKIDNKFQWGNEDCFIQFSNPNIVLFEDKTNEETTTEDILYYYYDIDIYRDITAYHTENEYKITTEKVASTRTFDFPCVIDLQNILNIIIPIDLSKTDNIHKDVLRDKTIKYKYQLDTDSIIYEDYYSVTKNQIEDKYWYDLFIGCSNNNSDIICGLTIKYSNPEDILELKKCIDGFIEYSIKNCIH